MATDSAIKDLLYPTVEDLMNKYGAAYKKVINNFIVQHHQSLYDTGPNDRIYYTDNDRDALYKAIHIDEKIILQALSQTYYWNEPHFSPLCAKDPTTILLLTIVRYYIQKGSMKEAELAAIYLAFSGKIYASLHVNSFRKFPPSENRSVMDYVINNKLTQKFDIKREGSVIGAVKSICITWINSYKDDKFKHYEDEDIKYLLDQIRNRVKAFIINIARVYYDAYEDREYLNYETSVGEEDNFRIADNDSLRYDRYVENTLNYITSNTVNYSFCRSDQYVKKDEIKSLIESIIMDNDNMPLIRDILEVLISDYMANGTHKDIHSLEFITYSLKAKPNCKNKNVLRMKHNIESWLDENSPNYRKRKTKDATKNSYYRSILAYFVLCINKSNKKG